MHKPILNRAQGCLLGQLAGDALGSLVEFESPEGILRKYPDGVRDLADGGTWNTIAGQPTDDSEMAISLARTLIEYETYDPDATYDAYVEWLASGPFDYGMTTAAGLTGRPKADSQANGALMRVSPLGIFGIRYDIKQVGDWARLDATLTHPHPICQQANALFVMAITKAIKVGMSPEDTYRNILAWADEDDMTIDPTLYEAIIAAATAPPEDFVYQQGWVVKAFQNALYQLLHAPSAEEGIIDTVMRGGDTDTNAAICGALLGAVYGLDNLPDRWVDKILTCRPKQDDVRVHKPRSEYFWPVDALEIAEQLAFPA